MTRPDRQFGQGPLSHVTGVVHWFVVLEVLLVAATAPGLVPALLLAQDAANLPLYALCAVPVGPAVAAALFAWRRFLADRDDSPVRSFLRGYRLNVADALRSWVPVLVLLTVLGTNLAHGEAAGVPAPFRVLYAVLAVVALLWGVRMLAVTSAFAFRWRDAARITLGTLLGGFRWTLGLLSLLVLAAGIAWVTFDAVVVLLASVLTFLLVRNEQPVLAHVRERFVAEP